MWNERFGQLRNWVIADGRRSSRHPKHCPGSQTESSPILTQTNGKPLYELALLVAVIVVTTADFHAQTTRVQGSPKDVIQQYLKLVQDGALLTSDGWNRVSTLFSSPSPEPEGKVVFLTSKHAGVGEVWTRDNRAEVHDAWWDLLGSIDPSLRYTPPPAVNARRNIGVYYLTVTDKHWELEPNGQMKEVIGPLHWEIEGPQTWRWTTVGPAIKYVSQMSEKSSDPLVKQNAERTISILKRYLR
jgi:hypothetical protein